MEKVNNLNMKYDSSLDKKTETRLFGMPITVIKNETLPYDIYINEVTGKVAANIIECCSSGDISRYFTSFSETQYGNKPMYR